jgi:hypothetical protein
MAVALAGAALASLLPTGTVHAVEPSEIRRTSFRETVKRGPEIEGEIKDFKVKSRLHYAFLGALKRVERLERCQGLFDEFGADGIDVLSNTTYVLADADWAKKLCASASAFTTVGGSKVWLCSNFGRLPEKDATEILLHEALHSAGLSEYPLDPNGLRPNEIDSMVRKNCGF